MLREYAAWIDRNYPTKEISTNQCSDAVLLMQSMFNELTIQVGRAGGRYHCWLRDNNGNIIDPTLKQFDSKITYTLIAERFLDKDEIELSTGAVFLKEAQS